MVDSKKDRRNKLALAIETVFFAILCIVFLLDAALGFIPEESITLVHIVMVVLVFEVFIMPFLIGKKAVRDACFKWKYSRKFFKPRIKMGYIGTLKERHVGGVIAIWIICWLAILGVRLIGLLTWELFMAGTCVLDILNAWFVRWHCWLATYVMKKPNCCAECTINGWDVFMFGSAFLICPTPNTVVFWVNIGVALVSAVLFVAWELYYMTYPERFSKKTNCGIGCAECKTRKCKNHK